MINLHIGTDEKNLWFGLGSDVHKHPVTKYCIEQVSEDMFSILIDLSKNKKYQETISELLSCLLDVRWINNN